MKDEEREEPDGVNELDALFSWPTPPKQLRLRRLDRLLLNCSPDQDRPAAGRLSSVEEQLPCKQQVLGSNPRGGSKILLLECAETAIYITGRANRIGEQT